VPYAFFSYIAASAANSKKEVLMKLLRKLCAVLTGIIIATVPVSAGASHENVSIRLDGSETKIGALLIGKTTYVPFDEANDALSDGTAEIMGDASDMTAVSPFATIRARENDCYLEANGRYFGSNGSIVISGMLYVPIRTLAKAYGADVIWDDSTRSVDLHRSGEALMHGDDYYKSDEVYWLSRIISAEAKGEPMDGKIMVGNVILNRVASKEFPDTIYGVIFDDEFGVQFTPTMNGSIYDTPTKDSIIAAKICLDGYYKSRDALYFLNPAWATNFWVPNNRPYLTTVGCHDFYA